MSENHWVREGKLWRNVKTGQTLVPIKGGGAPAWTQHAFRIRNDDGTEATATWMYAQSTNGSVDSQTKFRIRFRIDEYNDKTATIITPNLYYNYNSGGWNPITTSSSVIRNVASDYTFVDDTLVTTERLGSPFPASGAFEGTGRLDTNGSTSSSGVSVKNGYFESEFCLLMQNADVANGATLEIRFYDGTTALDLYTSPISITVSKSTAVNLTVKPLSQANTVDKVGITKQSTLVVDPLSQSNTVDFIEWLPANPTSFQFVQSNYSASVDTVTLTGVTAGNLIVLVAKWNTDLTDITGVSDGTSALTGGTKENGDGTMAIQFWYLISANGGDKTYTVTFPGSAAGKRLGVAEYSYDGSIVMDDENTGFANSGSSTTTGNITTTGSEHLVVGASVPNTGQTPSNYRIETKPVYELHYVTAFINIADHFTTTAGSMNFTMDWAGETGGWDAVIMSFKTTAPTLTVRALSQANTVDKVGITKQSDLVVDPLSQSNLVQHIDLTQVHVLIVDDLSQANLVEFITGITQQYELAPQNLSQSNLVEHITLVQVHNLQVYDLAQSNLVEHVSTTKESTLAIDNLSQSNLVEFITGMTQQQQLVVDDLSQSNLVSPVVLTQLHILTVDDLSQSNLVEHIDLTQLHILQVDDLSQSNLVEKVSLTQVHNLSVNDLSQSNLVEFLALSSEAFMSPKALFLASTVEKPSLTQVHNIFVNNLSQSSTVDKVTIALVANLVVADLSQVNKVSTAYWIQGLLYFVDHEEGDFSEYASYTSDPDFQVNTNSALIGAYGLERILGTQNNLYGSLNKGSNKYLFTQAISLRFYIDPNDATVSTDSPGVVIGLSKSGGYFAYVMLEGIFSSGNRQVYGRLFNDSSGYSDSLKKVITSKTCVEVLITRATNSTSSDGQMKIWIDDVLWDTISGVDNYNIFDKLYNITVGGWSFLSANWSGSFYVDDVVVRDDGQYIGPATVLSVANLSQANTVEKPNVNVQTTLTVADLSVNTALGIVTLVQIHNLIVSDVLSICKAVNSFSMNYETGDLREAIQTSTDGSNTLQVTLNAALVGTYGLEVGIDGGTQAYTTQNFASTNELFVECEIDPNGLTMGEGEQFGIISLHNAISYVNLLRAGSQYYLKGIIYTDSGSTSTGNYLITDAQHKVGMMTKISSSPGANDGFLELWIDGSKVETIANVDNDTKSIVNVRHGACFAVDAGTSGTFYTDHARSLFLLKQVHNLQVQNLSQANTVQHLQLATEGDATARNLSQASTVEKVSLTQVHNLTVSDLSQSNLVTKPNVNSETTLTVRDLSVSNTVEKVSLTQLHILSVDNLSQANTVEEVILSQVHVLNVHDLSQLNSVSKPFVSGEGTLVPFSLSQSNTVEKFALAQLHILGLAELSQLNSVESIVLVPIPKLVIYDLAQANSIDYAGITTTYNMMPYDLAQQTTTDLVIWGAVLEVSNLRVVSTLWNSSFWHEQFEWQVGIARYLYEDVTINTQTNIISAGIDRQSDVSEVDL